MAWKILFPLQDTLQLISYLHDGHSHECNAFVSFCSGAIWIWYNFIWLLHGTLFEYTVLFDCYMVQPHVMVAYIYTHIYICWILNTMLYITFVFYIFKVLHNWTIFFLNENFHVGIFSDICICYFFETQNDGLLLLSVLLHVHVSLDDL